MDDSENERIERSSDTPDDKSDKKTRKETLARLGTAFLGHAAESLMVRAHFCTSCTSVSRLPSPVHTDAEDGGGSLSEE